ncbi:hypothetical protein B0T26DRAFT_410362 [Lasiosphaeria miniovina]|uniref:Secreted protein n=1 Tax=Lasiosphaeria miniovina TaxID=1954250 RepID=A0AA40A5I7_9PEZI|nr:uncharacterized protein B0T26DRAFT_410362 [Lasiosphaeria miniovina]KAK0709546.1 hypothetical protein B0T26DRAFT_410362 [Lasiosphaeria miniovina]
MCTTNGRCIIILLFCPARGYTYRYTRYTWYVEKRQRQNIQPLENIMEFLWFFIACARLPLKDKLGEHKKKMEIPKKSQPQFHSCSPQRPNESLAGGIIYPWVIFLS